MAKILIIDDDEAICKALGKFLRTQKHEVVIAQDGKSGLAAALEPPDLIICDLAMPILDGHGVLAALRQDKRLEETPFIFLSGYADRESIRQSMNLGSDDFIPKPAELSEILATINSRLQRHQRQQQRREEEVKKAVQIFSGIVDDLGTSEAAIHWLAEVASNHPVVKPLPLAHPPVPPPPKVEAPPTQLEASPTFLATKDNRQYFVKLSEVKALLADGEYSRAIWGKDQSMMFRKPLKQWEKELPSNQFIRIHRKAIINLLFFDFVDQNPNGKSQVHLKEFKDALKVSQRKISTLNRALKYLEHLHGVL
jgi:DNA-binding LytR/AlgR family response regulator